MAPPSSCHSNFLMTMDCLYSKVTDLSRTMPAEKIQHIFTPMRSSLLNMMTHWERSRQGEGGWDPETDNPSQEHEGGAAGNDSGNMSCSTVSSGLGKLAGRPARALNMQHAFLNGKPSYQLFFWDVVDSEQLLTLSLQRLNYTAGATDGSSAPSVMTRASSSGGSRRGNDSDDDTTGKRGTCTSPSCTVYHIPYR